MGDDPNRQAAIEAFIATWRGIAGGAERSNLPPFIYGLTEALGVPGPSGPAAKGVLGDYEFEGTVKGGSFRSLKASGAIDLYKRGHFVLEAKQSYIPEARRSQPELYDVAPSAPATPAGARYDLLMRDARAQAENYAKNLPGDHPPAPYLIVCDIGRAFEIYFDFSGNGRGYGFFPDKQSYRIELEQLRDEAVRGRLRAIWTDPRSIDPRFQSAEVTRGIARRLADVSRYLEETNRHRARASGLESQAIEETSLFLMRIVFCMFAEDIGLLPKDRFKAFLAETVENQTRFEQGLHDLWAKMNARGGGFAWAVDEAVKWFNGGLFESNATYVLSNADRGELLAAARADWRKVEPAIFGTLLEQALTAEERAKLGAHYTPRPYVERLVRATVMDVLEAEWEAAQREMERALKSSPERGGGPVQPVEGSARWPGESSDDRVLHALPGPLHHSALPNGPPHSDPERVAHGEDLGLPIAAAFHDRLAATRVLDPACGTGNFLYVAMELMQRLEAEVIETIQGLGGEAHARVGPQQFHGLEKNPRAAKIAELVLWIGWLRFRISNNPDDVPEPVLKRSASINFGHPGGYDAVLWQTETGEPDLQHPAAPDWPEAEYIVGNPPFIGGKDIRDRLGGDYAEALWRANPSVPKSADFVMQWWDRAARILTAPGTRLRRFGFVTTNSITQEFSRRVIAGHLSKSSPERGGGPLAARVVEGSTAYASGSGAERLAPARDPSTDSAGPPPRSGEDLGLSLVLAIPDHPWTRVTRDSAAVRIAMTVAEAGAKNGCLMEVAREAGLDSDEPEIELSQTEARIHANLAVGSDITSAVRLLANAGICHDGVKLHGQGFSITAADAKVLGLGRREGLEDFIRPYRNGRDLTGRNPSEVAGKFVIDLFGLSESEVRQRFPEVYEHLLRTVKPERDRNRRATYRDNWWIFGEPRRELRPALDGLTRYVATVDTARHRVFQFLGTDVVCDDKVVIVASDNAFHLGVLQSRIHTEWALKAGGWLGFGNDSVYVKSKVFDPFPFPDASPQQRARIAELAEELDAARKAALAEVPGLTMTEIYNLREATKSSPERGGGAREARDGGGPLHHSASPNGPPPRSGEDFMDRAARARAGIVNRLHEQIDDAVAAAYGWPADPAPSEIVARLVALNAERSAEEKAGAVRWLRPDYQPSRFGGSG